MSDTPTDDELNENPDDTEISAEEEAAAEAAFADSFEVEAGESDERPAGTIEEESEPEDNEPAGDEQAAQATPGSPEGEGEDGAQATPGEGSEEPEMTMEQMWQTMEDLQGRLRRTEGHIGNIANDFRTFRDASQQTAAAGGEIPETGQILDAMASTEEFKKLQDEFPEFAAAMLATQRVQIEQQGGTVAGAQQQVSGEDGATEPGGTEVTESPQQIDLEAVFNQMRADARAEAADAIVSHEFRGRDWEQDIQSELFGAYLESLGEEGQRLATSDMPADAIDLIGPYYDLLDAVTAMGEDANQYQPTALVDMYNQGGLSSAPSGEEDPSDAERRAQEQQQRRNARLERSAPVTKGKGAGDQPKKDSEQDAFEAGFKSQSG